MTPGLAHFSIISLFFFQYVLTITFDWFFLTYMINKLVSKENPSTLLLPENYFFLILIFFECIGSTAGPFARKIKDDYSYLLFFVTFSPPHNTWAYQACQIDDSRISLSFVDSYITQPFWQPTLGLYANECFVQLETLKN